MFECACVGLVEQIENGHIEEKKTYEMLENWLKPMKENSVDTIVLGCTHYPLIDHIIKKIMGENIILIETGDAIANRLICLSENKGHKNLGELKISVCHTGLINNNMIKMILQNENIEVRNCTI